MGKITLTHIVGWIVRAAATDAHLNTVINIILDSRVLYRSNTITAKKVRNQSKHAAQSNFKSCIEEIRVVLEFKGQ